MGYVQLAIAAYGAYQAYKNKPSDEGARMVRAAMNDLAQVPVPDPNSLKIQMQQLVQQGMVSPQDAEAILIQHNAYDEATGSDQARGAQLEALQGFQDQAAAGGLTDTSRASIQAVQDEISNTQRGQDQAIAQDARRRGISGSGLEMAQRLISQQGAADRAGRQGMDVAALAEQAKVEALKNAAETGGQIEAQTFGEQAQKAAAANQIAQYNATNQQQVTLQNIAAQNAAQAANLAEKQRITDTNTQMENANRVRNADLIQQNYQNKLDKAKGIFGAATGTANVVNSTDAANRQYKGDLVGGLLNTVSNYGASGGFSGSTKKPATDTSSNSFLTNEAEQRKRVLGYAHGGRVKCYDQGGRVPGEAEYPGDDERNDDVLAKLSPGELVVPRTQADEVDSFLNDVPRTAQKPSVDAIKVMLQALTEMGC